MRPLISIVMLAVALAPARAYASIDEALVRRLMARLSGAEALGDGTRIDTRYVLRPEMLDRATRELQGELAACGVAAEKSPFHVALVDFTAAARLGGTYAVFGDGVLAYAAAPTGPFKAEPFPGTARAALRAGAASYAAGEFSRAQANAGGARWYLAPGSYVAAYQGAVYAAGATGALFVSQGDANFIRQADTGIAFGGLAASDTALWAISGRQLLAASDGVHFAPVLLAPLPWSAVFTVNGRVFAVAADGRLYDAARATWTGLPWGDDAAPDGWFTPAVAFREDGDVIFGPRMSVFWGDPDEMYAPVSPTAAAVVDAAGTGLLVAGRRGSLAYLTPHTIPRRIDAPVWVGKDPDPRFVTANNLIVHHPGSKLLLSGHLDSIAKNTPGWNGLTDPAPGADDDLSGVAALAAVACAQRGNPAFDVLFTAGEEVGLAGSYWEALGEGKGYDYEQMLTVDEVALPTRMVFIGYEDEASRSFAASLTESAPQSAPTRFFVAGEPTLIARADHYAYFLKGLRTVILSAGVPPPPQYHTINDTLARADVQPVVDTARLLERHVAKLAPPRKRTEAGGCAAGGGDGLAAGATAVFFLLAWARITRRATSR